MVFEPRLDDCPAMSMRVEKMVEELRRGNRRRIDPGDAVVKLRVLGEKPRPIKERLVMVSVVAERQEVVVEGMNLDALAMRSWNVGKGAAECCCSIGTPETRIVRPGQ